MNRADFVAADGKLWWLFEPQTDSRIEEARRELGTALGSSENEWYADQNRRTTLFDLLESHSSTLLNELDYLADDEARLQWVRAATHLAAPPPAAPSEDHTTNGAEPAQAATPPASPPSAPAKKSIFKSKAAADTPEPAQTADGATPDGAPAESPELDQAVQAVLANVTGDGLASLAQDLGVEPDELEAILNHPEFEREVREEVARITVG